MYRLFPTSFFAHPFVSWNSWIAHRNLASSVGNIVPVIVVHQWELHITHPVIHPTWWKERHMRTIETKGQEKWLIVLTSELFGNPGGRDVICKL